ncbi:FecR domain-containing protein [Fulvivirgaceae bacterium BMA12]|uniref:FecR domain-containing protein n=1 Tax=Agaribacillus aureus TaxID=3051825 RepID=A0ABT8L4T6_9BACT|nr:FecR domain-containing protein [Fulvivirgaceae bacterium BMA12]
MREKYINVEDFLADEEFKKWVINPSPQAQQYWSAWLKSNPDKREVLFLAKEIIESIEFEKIPQDVDASDKVLDNILKENKSKSLLGYSEKRPSSVRLNVFKFAASAVLAMVMVYLLLQKKEPAEVPQVVEVKPIIKENPKGRKSTIVLPDNSVVWLNADSKIEIPRKFSDTVRIVKLSGEAFFEVEKDPGRPFIVMTHDVEVTALGTAFNVKAFEEDKHVEVALTEGRVKVEHTKGIATEEAEAEFFLDPLQSIRFSKIDNSIDRGFFDLREVTGWKEGFIFFKDASFEEVIHKLERWYNVEFIVVNRHKIDEWKYSSQFHNENLENVLKSISFVKEFKFKIEDNTVTIVF